MLLSLGMVKVLMMSLLESISLVQNCTSDSRAQHLELEHHY